MTIEFCDSKTGLFCAGEATLALLPVFLFGYLGYQSYQNAQKITAYQTTNFTLRHVSKLVISLCLVAIALTFAIAYPLRNSTVAVETELVWVFDSLMWIVNVYLLRIEYKKLGHTTTYLRLSWLAALICHALLIVMNDLKAQGETSITDFDLEPIWFVYLAAVAALIIVGYIFSEDFTPDNVNDSFTAFAQSGDGTVKFDEQSLFILSGAKRASVSSTSEIHAAGKNSSLLNRSDDFKRDVRPISREQKPIDIPTEDRKKPQQQQSNQQQSTSQQQYQPPEIKPQAEESKASDVTEEKKKKVLKVGSAAYFRENLSKLEKIEVSGWESMMRDERNTIVYVIEFDINRQKFTAKRSLSEFGMLMLEMSKKFPAINFPERPVRTKVDEEEKELKERAATFDKFLNICLKNELFTSRLAQFLASQAEVPIFGKSTGARDAKKRTQTTVVENKTDKDIHAKDDSEVSVYNESVPNSIQNSMSRSVTLLGENIIPDYTVNERTQPSQEKQESKKKKDKFYNVEALAAFFQGTKKDTYYKFRVKEVVSGDVFEMSKRYSEFKTLDETLREYFKKDAVSLPALPYKGHLSFMISKRDNRVIEYRKVALKTYLQTLLNDKNIRDNQIFMDFMSA